MFLFSPIYFTDNVTKTLISFSAPLAQLPSWLCHQRQGYIHLSCSHCWYRESSPQPVYPEWCKISPKHTVWKIHISWIVWSVLWMWASFFAFFLCLVCLSLSLQNIYKEASRSGMAKGYELPYDTPAIKHAKQTSLNCSDVSETISLSCSHSPLLNREKTIYLINVFLLCFF